MNNMQTFVTKTKITPPEIQFNTLRRDSLISQIQQLQGKRITIITAPGGYGKTVLASQIIKYSGKPFVWYQIDEADNDPIVFFYYLMKAFSESIKDFNVNLNFSTCSDKKLNNIAYGIATFLIDEIEKIEHDRVYLVLDDFHFIQDKVIVEFLNVFLKYLPEKIHLIITSRSYLELDISKIKSFGYLTELGRDKLIFSYQDFINFSNLKSSPRLDEDKYKAIYDKSEGWPMALNVFLQESDKYYDYVKESKENVNKRDNTFFDFFLYQIFNNLPQNIRSFLTCISILDEIRPDVCAYITGTKDVQDVFEFLVKNNIFINRLAGDEEIYTCHQLFKEFLQSQMQNNINEIYKKAVEYCYSQKRYSEAMEYLIRVGNKNDAIKVLKFAGIEAVRGGRLKTVERWLSYFKNSNYDSNEWIMLIQSSVYTYKGMFSMAEKHLNCVIDYFYKEKDNYGYYIALTIQAKILFYRSSLKSYIKTLDKVIDNADEVDDLTLYDAFIKKTFGQIIKGDINEAIVTLELGIEILARRGNDRLVIFMQRYLTAPYFMKFEYHKAIQYYELTHKMSLEEINLTECFSVDIYAARTYRDMGRLEEAKNMMEKIIRKKEALGYTEDIFAVYYHLATLYRDTGEYELALKYATLSDELLRQGGSLMEFSFLIKILKGLILSDIGDMKSALKIGKEALSKLINGESKFMVEVAYYSAGVICVRAGEIEKAKEYFETGYRLSQKEGVRSMVPVCTGLLVGLYIERDYKKSLSYAKKSLEFSSKQNYIQVYVTNSEMDECLSLGIIHNIELDFITEIVKRLNKNRKNKIMKLLKKYGNQGSLEKFCEIVKLDKTILEEFNSEIDEIFLDLYGEKNNCFIINFNKMQPAPMPYMIVSCFGNFKVYTPLVEKGAVRWRTSKSKELLAYFINNSDKELSTEKILADVWQDIPLNKSRNLFYTNMVLVRQILRRCNLLENLKKIQSGYFFEKRGIYCDWWFIEDIAQNLELLNDTFKENLLEIFEKGYLEDIQSDWTIEQRIEYEKIYNKLHFNKDVVT